MSDCKMDFGQLKQWFLKLLDSDSDVRDKISAMPRKEEDKNASNELSADNQQLNEELNQLRTEIANLQKEKNAFLDTIKQEAAELLSAQKVQKDLEKKLRDETVNTQKWQKKTEDMTNQYNNLKQEKAELDGVIKPFKDAFDKYRRLTPKVKEQLHSIFPHDDLWDFIFCGIREDNLTSLWDFCANTIKNGGDNLAELMALFDFFLQWNHRQYETPKFKRLDLAVGDKYSEDKAQRDRTSDPQGKIASVLFQGLAYAVNNKIVRKSIVHIAQ